MTSADRLVIVCAKIISYLIKFFRLGAGATWPGEIALRFRPNLMERFGLQRKKIILIVGTNGKTTTTKLLETIFRAQGYSVRHNESGANLDNGILSIFIDDADASGRLRSENFIFEVDEAALPLVLDKINPTIVVLLNLFRDQLDRYGEIDTIAEKWHEALDRLGPETTLIANADDPHIAYLTSILKSPTRYFGLSDKKLYLSTMQHATDTIYCPSCGKRLVFTGIYFSHLGDWKCPECGFTHPHLDGKAKDFPSPLEGVYNIYNTLAACLSGVTLGVSRSAILEAISTFTPAFGRLEHVEKDGKHITILLSKNPTGFNESLRTALTSKTKGPLLLVLNDRIPDGRDVSWIWDVDFEELQKFKHFIHISGDRCYDMALRLKYAEVSVHQSSIFTNLEQAIQSSLEKLSQDETLWVLATYSAMLEVREIIGGKKIL